MLHQLSEAMLKSVQAEEDLFLTYITVLHIVNQTHQEPLNQFQELVSRVPAILKELCQKKDEICATSDTPDTSNVVRSCTQK